jgi:hypothetical protein
MAGNNVVETRAYLWTGTAASAVDLHPAGSFASIANGVYGSNQVGWAATTPITSSHAMLWSGSAASVVDLNPVGHYGSQATAIWGTTQVGWGTATSISQPHALLWNGTASSFVDLHPAGFERSQATDAAGTFQVGHGIVAGIGGTQHALVWNGSAASAVDLHPFVTALDPSFDVSYALGFAEDGRVVGFARKTQDNFYAVMWTPIPEPSTSLLAFLAVLGFLAVKGRRSCDRWFVPAA